MNIKSKLFLGNQKNIIFELKHLANTLPCFIKDKKIFFKLKLEG